MKRFVLDTNVLSEQTKPRPNLGLNAWLAQQKVSSCFICIISIAEIEQGIALLGNNKRAQRYRLWLGNLEQEYFGNIVALEREIASVWSQISSQAILAGRTPGFSDSWIAATAVYLEAAVVTRNESDFAGLVEVVNPWSD
jgi:toxin FitB